MKIDIVQIVLAIVAVTAFCLGEINGWYLQSHF